MMAEGPFFLLGDTAWGQDMWQNEMIYVEFRRSDCLVRWASVQKRNIVLSK